MDLLTFKHHVLKVEIVKYYFDFKYNARISKDLHYDTEAP